MNFQPPTRYETLDDFRVQHKQPALNTAISSPNLPWRTLSCSVRRALKEPNESSDQNGFSWLFLLRGSPVKLDYQERVNTMKNRGTPKTAQIPHQCGALIARPAASFQRCVEVFLSKTISCQGIGSLWFQEKGWRSEGLNLWQVFRRLHL